MTEKDTPNGPIHQGVRFVGALARTLIIVLVKPLDGPQALLADRGNGQRNYVSPTSFLAAASLFWAFGLSDIPGPGEFIESEGEYDQLVVWGALVMERLIDAMAFDRSVLSGLSIAVVHGASIYAFAATYAYFFEKDDAGEATFLLIYIIAALPIGVIMLSFVMSLFGVWWLMVVVVLVYGIIAPWLFFAGWSAMGDSTQTRDGQAVDAEPDKPATCVEPESEAGEKKPPGGSLLLAGPIVVPVAIFIADFVEEPFEEAFNRSKVAKVFAEAHGESSWDGEAGKLRLEIRGQLDASRPRELDPTVSICPPDPRIRVGEIWDKSTPWSEREKMTSLIDQSRKSSRYSECLGGRFDENWIPSGGEFTLHLNVAAKSPGFTHFLGGWTICEYYERSACFTGFRWPENFRIWPRAGEKPSWNSESNSMDLSVTGFLNRTEIQLPWQMWLCDKWHGDCLPAKLDNVAVGPVDSLLRVTGKDSQVLDQAKDLSNWKLCAEVGTINDEARYACLWNFSWPGEK